jgi:hypothetical protein
MTYIINKTDGTVLTEIIDGNIDQSTTDLTLIGKSANAYGEYINENLVRLLENFANSTQPKQSIPGQLWFDTLEKRLKVYDGKGYKVSGGTIVAPMMPSSISQGDIWIKSNSRQLWCNNGVETFLVGPQDSSMTGISVVSVYGTDQNSHTVIKLMIDDTLVAVISSDSFIIDTNSLPVIYGWPSTEAGPDPINQGLNLVSNNPNSENETKPLITNVRTSSGTNDVVNNERLLTAVKQTAPYAISLDISGLHNAANDAEKHTKIGLMLEKLFPVADFDVGNFTDQLPTCRVLCTDGSIKTVRTFKLSSGTGTSEEDTVIKWRQVNDVITVSSILT